MDFTPYLFPVIGCLIGYSTNYIAVKMLFRPHNPVGIGPFKIQGLLPKRRNDISVGIAATVENELISMKDLTRVLKALDLGPEIDRMVDGVFEPSEYTGKSELLGKINTTINAYLRSRVRKSVNANKDELISGFIKEIERNVDFKDIIVKNLESYEIDQLEDIVLRVSSRELRYITIIGGVLGFLVGLAQMAFYIVK